MRKLLFPLLVIFVNNIGAQNVGIGTLTPNDKLSVVNTLSGYGITHSYGPVTVGTYLTVLNAQFGTRTNHPLQFFTNNGAAQITLLQNGNVGIGTVSPTEKLDVVGTVISEGNLAGFHFNDRGDNAKGYQWYANGGNAYLYRHHATTGTVISVLGNNNIGFNTSAPQANLHVNPNGAGGIQIGTNKSSGGYTILQMGISAQSGGYSYLQSTQSSGTAYGKLILNQYGGDVQIGAHVIVAGYIGINNASPSHPIDIIQGNGELGVRLAIGPNRWTMSNSGGADYAAALKFSFNNSYRAGIDHQDGGYYSSSDKRLKKNIEELSPVLARITQLKAKTYEFIQNPGSSRKTTGFVSQDVIPLFPDLVNDFKNNSADSTIYHGINYAGFSVIAIKAIQEQQEIIETLHSKLDAMEKRLLALESKK